MRRRTFIVLLGALIGWPLTARAQQTSRIPRVAVLTGYAQDDPEVQLRIAAFEQGLRALGWINARNVQIIYRFGASSDERLAITRAIW
jgi:putative tryptophan/tyrosine transport system substrate-binding protein